MSEETAARETTLLTGYRLTALQVFRWGTMLFLLSGVVQIFLAGLGVFDLGGHKLGSTGESAFDPHRMNGTLMTIIALLLLIAVLLARPSGQLIGMAVVLLVLMAVGLPLLAAGGEHQAWLGGLHAILGVGLLGLASRMLVEARTRLAGPVG